jgi:hypothetical protein
MPDRDIGIGRKNRLGLIRHLVFKNMGLMLDTFAARQGRQPHHFFGYLKAATVVDADFGDHEGRMVGANAAIADLHSSILIRLPRFNLIAGARLDRL